MTASPQRRNLFASWRSGLAGLRLQSWVLRQPWLRPVYRVFPRNLRDRVFSALSARSVVQTQFQRTDAWELSLESAEISVPNTGDVADTRLTSVGINILGYIRGEFGLAESARMYARALINAGVPVSLYDLDLGLPHSWEDRSLDGFIDQHMPHKVTIVFVNPDYLDAAFEKVGRARMEGHYIIACWFWELEVIPSSWLSAITLVDEIMVASRFIEDAFRDVTDKPIMRLPLPLSDQRDSGLQRRDFGLEPEAFVFLFTFDFHSFVTRKNPQAVVNAFRHAFPDDRDDVRLVVKSSNGHMYPEQMAELLSLVAADKRILLRDEVIDRMHVRALQRCCDVYVSLHRAEGFGLGLAECMSLGRPVIATGWSGNMEFMTDSNSCLVDYDLVPVAGRYPESDGARWAEPRIDSAAAAMRRLADDPLQARRLGEAARDDICARLAPPSVAEHLLARAAKVVASTH
ncbi:MULTISPECIES: glycosyltransferase family 4 protein [Xanthomonas]|uniref:Glycosyltransferase family 4 protein n=1 Tax=Xanthomonas cucurbitae TaxID=56453 RepID=A0ABY7YE00_9XANT|nr:glycosyltransferase [Xanthomonas cucurbitae]WDM68231.1 glycosyltransferase family 4 protein [Xanthomonas cucurbitae]WDM72105.1 glycosyltransferase family 4 protein [Xanthomonas cucurbitae]WDM75900.1 glycosyltransferase family 4 protein [Xanthomonas cucurbitae]